MHEEPSQTPLSDAVMMIAREIHHVAESIAKLSAPAVGCVTTSQFNAGIQTIMSAFTEFKSRFDAYQARHDVAVEGIASDVSALKDQIAALQATGPGWSAEDQAALDAMEAQVASAVEKLEALDALTAPVVPPVEPPVE